MSANKQTLFPGMRYADAPAAIEWLGEAFGFEPQFVVPGPDGTIAHAQLRYGASMIMLGSASDDASFDVKTPEALGGNSMAVYVFVDDIDAHYARATSAGALIVRVLAETEYGSREYAAKDLEGRLWSFGTYHPDLAQPDA